MAVKVAEAKAFRIVLALSVVAAALTDCPDEAGEDFHVGVQGP